MCGIIGYVGNRPAEEILVAGLQKLEYRGYDSAGVAILAPEEGVKKVRAVGNLDGLRSALEGTDLSATTEPDEEGHFTGIAHTRWATHGRVTEANAHPHGDESGKVQIVLNGIVENYVRLKGKLQDEGVTFTSETDAEVVAHLIERYYEGDLTEAVRRAYADLRGHYSIVAMHSDAPGVLVGARKETPLIVGVSERENFIASAIPAFLNETRLALTIDDGEIVTLTADGVTVTKADGEPVERDPEEFQGDAETAEKGGYDTFMMKEIHEQPEAIAETILDRLTDDDSVDLSDIGFGDEVLKNASRIVIVACGTSYHAGLVGRYAIERWARVPVEMDIASEYRYRDPVIGENDLVIGITQSGETADTLAAMRLARDRGAKVLAITNIMGSQATRDSDAVLFTRAGLEIGVAATKTFVAQVAAMYLVALRLAELRDTIGFSEVKGLINELRAIPEKMEATIDSESERMLEIAKRHYQQKFFLYLGRHIGLPVCLEGALKLKEVSYIPTDAYAAGEMKHGPIALLDESTPVVCVATDSPILDKVLSNMEEVKARGADVIAVATEGDDRVSKVSEETIQVPRTDWVLQPLLAILPLQLLAYHVARLNGLNVDQPRNLAKTVTVE
ncbi:MAG: glutamine--fructose-6-phosphate transaminase (isomerizing) [Solirubrobacterales bacterium]|nr:glutamine--fructose-6-phosphate transaminase (isomerizing) [Solirubrobacterales bacterium]OJU93499.1 MAG: glutamine--fructose-6-phosphate aminotransferase [Solirubrobacterales bacterium 67-14]